MLLTLVLVGALAVGLGTWAGVRAVRDTPVVGNQIPGMIAVEVGLVVQAVVVAVGLGRGASTGDPALLWGYLITELLLLPAAFAWAFVERTRWSSVVLAVASAVVVVLQVRVWQIWQGAG